MACGVFREFCVNPGFCETESEWGAEACAQCEAARANNSENKVSTVALISDDNLVTGAVSANDAG